jgi:hypothetical protein
MLAQLLDCALANGIIAKRIVELAKAGERNPDLLCIDTGVVDSLKALDPDGRLEKRSRHIWRPAHGR